VGNDFNNVSLEEEMAKLTQNRVAYEAYMRMVRGSVDKLNNIIKEGRQ
jgi:flagellar basal-body rod protein FlgB